MTTTPKKPLHKIPVYEVRLRQARRPLLLAETALGYPDVSAHALHGLIGLTDREHFALLFLNAQTHVVGAHIAAVGGQHLIGCIDPRVILRAALATCANAIVLGHNHPSGDPTPSPEDFESTAHLMRAADVVGIPVVDHVIVTRDPLRYYSMCDRGTLPPLR